MTSRKPLAQPSNNLPYELVEMIIDHLIYDIPTLKACSLLGNCWYIVAAPHIHRTFVIRGGKRCNLKTIPKRRERGLLHLTQEIQIRQYPGGPNWFRLEFFRRLDARHFFAFDNIQSLSVQCLDISGFLPRPHHYFHRLSPTLRSLTLDTPLCTPRELYMFISLFPNLDDIEIRSYTRPEYGYPDRALVPYHIPKFQGQLTLRSFYMAEVWQYLAAPCGLRFRSIHFHPVPSYAPFLFAVCAETLETLRIEPYDEFGR